VALDRDGRHALSASDDYTLRWWDLAAGTARVLEGHTAAVSAVALTSDGRHALSGSDDRTLRWWDLATGRCLAVFAGNDPFLAVACCPTQPRRCCAGDARGRFYLFNVEGLDGWLMSRE
jgi:WD40 repeat protein